MFSSAQFEGASCAVAICGGAGVRANDSSKCFSKVSIVVHLVDVARARCCCLGTLGLMSSSTCSRAVGRPVGCPDGIRKNAKVMKVDARIARAVRVVDDSRSGNGLTPPIRICRWTPAVHPRRSR